MSQKSNQLPKEAQFKYSQLNTRRLFLKQCSMGLAGMAFGSAFAGCGLNEGGEALQKTFSVSKATIGKLSHFAPKAKSVIFLHMAGAPSQLELFDYKPDLQKLHDKECPPSLLEGKKFAFIRGVPKMLGPQANFKRRGQSGAWVSDFLPHLTEVVDEVTFLKAMHTDQFNHAPAQMLMHTGSAQLGRPSMGSWVTYGLGSENENLPGYMVLTSGGSNPDAGKQVWGSGFLPSVYQGVQCRTKGDPVLYLSNPEGMKRDLRKASIDAINKVNKLTHDEFKDPETLARIAQYEMAFRMQIAVPEVMNIADEPAYIHEMYGTEPGKAAFANNALLARKLVEKGVRFVQLFDWGWDTHGTSKDGSVDYGLLEKCKQTDQAVGALLKDLKQRGLLEETLVVWAGEFGRTPMQENRNGVGLGFKGRDHHSDAFTIWMAGGGIKQGYVHGETDEIGYYGISGKQSIYDAQATILHQLGFDHEKFTYDFQGRAFRLTDVEGHVIRDIIA